MTAHILHIAIGPVQDFIAQARRTRDLWHGSHLVSELSRTAARALVDADADLLIPALDLAELAPCDADVRPAAAGVEAAPPLAVANKLYALLGPGHPPEQVAVAVRAAVMADLRSHAAKAKLKVAELLADDVDALWDEQVDTLLDFTAAWTPYAGDGDLAAARLRVDAAAGARKQLRDFGQWARQGGNVPKSSLDGARATVLPSKVKKPVLRAKLQHKFKIPMNEELDAIGVIKRVGSDPSRFAPIINVALAPWIDSLDPQLLERCKAACAKFDVQRIQSPAWTRAFPFEASVLLESRWESLFVEWGKDRTSPGWDAVERSIRALYHQRTPYEPYVACLVADGDKMGDALEQIGRPDKLKAFSRRLSSFAAGARSIVEQHRGMLVFAGGDDVLAFVPVALALECADALRNSFAVELTTACGEAGVANVPTLSVGIGIGHYMESMGELLELGRRAEKLAKGGELGDESRNALAVLLRKRSGSERTWRMRWDGMSRLHPCDSSKKPSPLDRIAEDLALLRAQLPIRKVHELGALLRRLPEPGDVADEQQPVFAELLTDEVRRTIERIGVDVDDDSRFDPNALITSVIPNRSSYTDLRQHVLYWINRMLIARAIDESTPRSGESEAQQ